MKRTSTLVLLFAAVLMMLIIPAVQAENAVTDPSECPAGTIADPIGDGEYNCIDDPTTDPGNNDEPCLSGMPSCPPVITCQLATVCPPVITNPCYTATVCPPGEEVRTAPVVTTPAPANDSPQGDGITFNDSDLGVSLYVSHDENDNPVPEVYETNNNTTNGNFALTVSREDLAPFAEALPTQNLLLKSAGHVNIYVLTTGEIAIFVGPDSEGKVHVKVFDGIPWSHVYGFTIDPQ